jgi:uncharacterized membrane protein YhaH (DUF805 family)
MNNLFNVVEDTKDLSLFTSQTLVIILSAVPIVIIDLVFQRYRDNNKSNMMMRNILNMIQIILSIIYVYFLMILFKKMSTHFQTTLPGMFFPGIFFSLQYNMFTDIHDNVKSILSL